jgi:hypothetical protein
MRGGAWSHPLTPTLSPEGRGGKAVSQNEANFGNKSFYFNSLTARQPMSRRQKPWGQSMRSTTA